MCATWYSSFSLTQAELPPLNWKILQKKHWAVAEIYCLDSIIVCSDYIREVFSYRPGYLRFLVVHKPVGLNEIVAS
jgi:hypothetical protein